MQFNLFMRIRVILGNRVQQRRHIDNHANDTMDDLITIQSHKTIRSRDSAQRKYAIQIHEHPRRHANNRLFRLCFIKQSNQDNQEKGHKKRIRIQNQNPQEIHFHLFWIQYKKRISPIITFFLISSHSELATNSYFFYICLHYELKIWYSHYRSSAVPPR